MDKSTTPLTQKQTDIILNHLGMAMFFAHAADLCNDDHEIQLTADQEPASARGVIAHVGLLLRACAEKLGVPEAQLEVCSNEALEKAKARALDPKH